VCALCYRHKALRGDPPPPADADTEVDWIVFSIDPGIPAIVPSFSGVCVLLLLPQGTIDTGPCACGAGGGEEGAVGSSERGTACSVFSIEPGMPGIMLPDFSG